jgi:hypothetical protein
MAEADVAFAARSRVAPLLYVDRMAVVVAALQWGARKVLLGARTFA